MNFKDTHINKEKRYSLGIETNSGKYYLSFPVSNSYVDYEEYYEIEKNVHISYPQNSVLVEDFLHECKNRLHDHLLFLQPGKNRGIPT
jgi:hypothetical protein